MHEWQEHDGKMQAFADSDWAGDRVTRKSTSGGPSMLGNHMTKSWSPSLPVIALSSGEAELYAFVKAAAQAKGLASLMLDFDLSVETVVRTDSTLRWARSTEKASARFATLSYNICGFRTRCARRS